MSTTWRISKSRPSTGSILPVLAFSVRLTVNWSRLGVLPPRDADAADGAPGAAAAAPAACASSLELPTIEAKSLRSESA